MKTNWIQSVRGYVLIEVRGKQLEKLLNRLTEKHMVVWDIRYLNVEHAEMMISIKDFFRLRQFIRGTGLRIRVRGRFGLPFWLNKLERRKFFAIGILCFFIGIYLLSSVVWQVRVEGNERLKADQILQAAKHAGVYPMQWKFRLKEPSELARTLQSQLPEAAWIGVEVQGTHVIIKIVESKIPAAPELMNPRHLVASKNAMVTQIFAEKGRPVVKPNTYVRQGDILISGILGDEMNSKTVVAQGSVKGLVWYKPTVEVPLTQQYKVYTGETKERFYLVIGNRGLQLTGYGKVPYEQFESIPVRKTLGWRDYSLPIGWINEKLMETRTEERQVDPKDARTIGIEQARKDILVSAGKDARIASEKILHEKAENGKVYIEILFEVEESIAVEQPIVP